MDPNVNLCAKRKRENELGNNSQYWMRECLIVPMMVKPSTDLGRWGLHGAANWVTRDCAQQYLRNGEGGLLGYYHAGHMNYNTGTL